MQLDRVQIEPLFDFEIRKGDPITKTSNLLASIQVLTDKHKTIRSSF